MNKATPPLCRTNRLKHEITCSELRGYKTGLKTSWHLVVFLLNAANFIGSRQVIQCSFDYCCIVHFMFNRMLFVLNTLQFCLNSVACFCVWNYFIYNLLLYKAMPILCGEYSFIVLRWLSLTIYVFRYKYRLMFFYIKLIKKQTKKHACCSKSVPCFFTCTFSILCFTPSSKSFWIRMGSTLFINK